MLYTNAIRMLPILAVIIPVCMNSLAYAQLSLTVNQDTGEVLISNNGTTDPVSFNAYSVGSQQNPGLTNDGLLVSGNWLTLAPAGGWLAAASPSSELVGESNVNSSTSLAVGATQSLGNLYTTNVATIADAQLFAGFGNDYRDLVFQYSDAGNGSAIVNGAVNYTGTTRENNFVLVVDAADGSAEFVNESGFAVEIEAFGITSSAGSLNPIGWNGINDALPVDWNLGSAANNGLVTSSDFDPTIPGPTDPFLVSPGASFDLGNIFNVGGARDLQFSFLRTSDAEGFAGVVRYLSVPGDFDEDGDVDGEDFLRWQRGQVSTPPAASDLDDWKANYGTVPPAPSASTALTRAVPEPSSCLLAVCGLIGLGFRCKN